MLQKLFKRTCDNSFNIFKQTRTQIKYYATKEKTHETDTESGETKQLKKVNDILGKYKEEEVAKILHVVNNYSLKELQGYDISKSRATKLLAYRMRNGSLNDLNDIFFVEGFSLKVAHKFYQSLMEEPKALAAGLEKSQRVKTAPFLTPSMDAHQRMNIQSSISVRIGVNSITWSKFEIAAEGCNEPCHLTHWQYHEISEKKLHLSDLIQRCLYVCHHIPTADCYIFENPQMAQASNNPGSVDQQNINIQKAQVTAMIGYALASRNSPHNALRQFEQDHVERVPTYPVVFYVRRFLTARLFNNLVGTERVSSEQNMLELMRTHYNAEDMEDTALVNEDVGGETKSLNIEQERSLTARGQVQFPMELRQMFSQASRYQREFLGQALLLNLAFVRLVLLQDPKSVARVSRGGGKKNDVDE